MTYSLSVVNQKGGVGKTTTAVNLAACLARAGRNVLLVDLDQQCNATQHIGQRQPASEADSSYSLFIYDKPDAARLVVPAGPNLALIPGHIALAEVDLRLASTVNPDGRLRRALSTILPQYDYCLLDCPPSIGRATINAMNVSTHLVVAVETAWFAYEAVQRLAAVIGDVVEQSNPGLEVFALATKRRLKVKMDSDVLERVRETFGANAFETVIRHTVAFVEAAAAGQSIVDYANGSGAHQDYQNLAKEVISRVEKANQADYSAIAN